MINSVKPFNDFDQTVQNRNHFILCLILLFAFLNTSEILCNTPRLCKTGLHRLFFKKQATL